MQRWRAWVVVGVFTVGFLPGPAWAGEMDVLLNKLVEKGILTASDAQEIRSEINPQHVEGDKALEQTMAETAKSTVPEWVQNMKWGGDIRLREESRNRTGSGQDVNRQRIRFRYGVDAKVSDNLRVGARLATGSTADPVSTNQSLNTSFNHKTILLDRAFVEYATELPGKTQLRLTGGIMETPFWWIDPLVWDEDLNFDGAAIHLTEALGPAVTLFTHDGVFSLQTDITEAATLWSTQAGIALKPFLDAREEVLKNLKVSGALAYHDYKNVTNPLSESTALSTAGGSKGNSATIQDLNLFNPTVELASQVEGVPVSIFGDWVHNTAMASGNNGFQVGLKAGKAVTPFHLKDGLEGGYYFERLEPDATLGAFTESDFGNGGTNHRGHVWWVKLATLKNSGIQLKYFNTQEVKDTKNHADTFQADWVTKF